MSKQCPTLLEKRFKDIHCLIVGTSSTMLVKLLGVQDEYAFVDVNDNSVPGECRDHSR